MKQATAKQSEVFWPRIVIRKWLNISNKESDFSADPDEGDCQFDSDDEEEAGIGKKQGEEDVNVICSESTPKLRRRNSETLRAQYIDTKEIRICVGTWNAGGKLPPDDLNIDDWLCIDEPADIYVLGFQEVVPLNPGNIFGAEDTRPVPKWENIIRETLNRVRPLMRFKSYSDPPTPSKFEPSEDFPDIEDEVLQETDSDENEEEIHPSNDESGNFDTSENPNLETSQERDLQRQFSSPKRLSRLGCFRVEESTENSEPPIGFDQVEESMENLEPMIGLKIGMLSKTLSRSERVGLSWPEPPMNLLPQSFLEKSNSLKKAKSFRATKSLRMLNSFKASSGNDSKRLQEPSLLTDIDLESIINRKRRSPYVRIISKQMVGIFLSVWVRRSLRRHIQNVKVSTVGVGVMGYIGNKGSVSVSMSIYQTLFCCVCTHLTSGEKNGDELKRNADVHEIHRRTQFHLSGIGLTKTILDHEKIIWLGDLNYRINLSYEKVRELISKKKLSLLAEKDQLMRELRKGGAFDGWKEGILNFPPTYKYELNSKKYYGDDPKVGRRTPAWCDRILSFGKGIKLLNYKRNETILSDHRPVTAIYMAEVEVFSHRKLQKALTITDAELEDGDIIQDFNNLDDDLDELDVGMSSLVLTEDTCGWER